MSQATLTINIDGAARGNPGPAAFAVVIARDGAAPLELSGCLGEATNNVAEYTALLRALEKARELKAQRLMIRSDSELLVKQMNGDYKVKNEQLRGLYEQAQRLTRDFDAVTLTHVRREQNKEADRLCNEALDGRKGAAAPTMKPRAPAPRHRGGKEESVREAAVACLQTVQEAWARGDRGSPTAEQVWEQLWDILQENGMLRT